MRVDMSIGWAVYGIFSLLAVGLLGIWLGEERYDHGYNESYRVGYSEALSPWLEVQPEIQWHSTEVFIIKDIDKYIVDWHPPLIWPIHYMRKPWISEGELFLSDDGDSVLLRYDTLGWEDWDE